MADIEDPVNIGTALDLASRRSNPPMACCPHDDEPLMATFERRGAEFMCMVCGTYYGFLAPKAREATPELQARHDELRARFDAGERP
jgi:hypothetical protein